LKKRTAVLFVLLAVISFGFLGADTQRAFIKMAKDTPSKAKGGVSKPKKEKKEKDPNAPKVC
jgi:hypothetical protein